MLRIESVNIGKAQAFANGIGRTGIYKAPVNGPVRIGLLGVEGDCVADAKHHGGRDQAVYIYFAGDYDWWSKELCCSLAPGTFGDNLTISGIASPDVAIGDRFVTGKLVLEVTAPRIPCNTLARRMEDSAFVKAFRDAERPGVYCRVIVEGEVEAGAVTYEPYPGDRIGIIKMYRDWFVRKGLSAADLRRTLAAPLGERARRDWEDLLARVS